MKATDPRNGTISAPRMLNPYERGIFIDNRATTYLQFGNQEQWWELQIFVLGDDQMAYTDPIQDCDYTELRRIEHCAGLCELYLLIDRGHPIVKDFPAELDALLERKDASEVLNQRVSRKSLPSKAYEE